MGKIVLITGGSRSGKSTYAQSLAESLPGKRAFVATCPIVDKEMDKRIEIHRQHRLNKGWQTIEEPLDLTGVMRSNSQYDVLLVDCLTLWVNNVLHEADGEVTEDDISSQCSELLDVCSQRNCTVIFVTNEVGMGIVPNNALARRYRDLVGRCNQMIAAIADEVVLVTCGIATKLKEVQ